MGTFSLAGVYPGDYRMGQHDPFLDAAEHDDMKDAAMCGLVEKMSIDIVTLSNVH